MQSVCKYIYANTQKFSDAQRKPQAMLKMILNQGRGEQPKKKSHLGYQTETVCVFLAQGTSSTMHLIGFLSKNQ